MPAPEAPSTPRRRRRHERGALAEERLASGAADGFGVIRPVLPSDLDTFAAQALPELRRHGMLRETPAGATLRERPGPADA